MSKACTVNKTRLKNQIEDGSHKKPETKQDPAQPHVIGGIAKTITARNQRERKAIQDTDPAEPHPCSQEPLLDLSQDVDSQREVRWDCQSPETVKKLKKCQGQYSSNEIRNIVDNFHDAPDNLSNSVRFFIPSNDEIVPSRQSIPQKEKGKVIKKHKQRVQDRDSLQRMVQLFHDQTPGPKSDFKLSEALTETYENHISHEKDDRSIDDVSTGFSKNINSGDESCWSDDELFQNNSFLIEATQNPEKFLNADELSKQYDLQPKIPVRKNISVSADSLTFSKSLEANEPEVHETLLGDSFVIPPSCASRKPTSLGAKASVPDPISSLLSHSLLPNTSIKNVHELKDYQEVRLHNIKTAVTTLVTKMPTHVKNTRSYANKCSPVSAHDSKPPEVTTSALTAPKGNSLNNSSCASASKYVSQNSQSVIVNSRPGATYKTSFRKFSSFQVENSQSGIRNVDRNKKISNSNLNSSFRKTLSFDSSLSNTGHYYKKNKLSVPDFSEFVVKSEPTLVAADNLISQPDNVSKSEFTELKTHPEKVSSVVQEDGFDVSLPHDVFQKLLEVDEILNSETDIITTNTTNVMSQLCDKKAQMSDAVLASNESKPKLDALKTDVISLPTAINGFTSCGSPSSVPKKKSRKKDSHIPVTDSKNTHVPVVTGALLSPVRSLMSLQMKQKVTASSPTCVYFKKTFSLKKNSPHHLRAGRHLRPSLPSSSTPVKCIQNGGSHYVEDKDTTQAKECSASFLDNVFDDSFTNDNALFESQILPTLEKLEAEALLTQNIPSSSAKCSSQEIEKKRQAALQKRSQKLSQMSPASVNK